jgi:leader peptidase (prepilin peptidase) / N-methyltransferase
MPIGRVSGGIVSVSSVDEVDDVPSRSACGGTRAAARVESPSRISITINSRRAAISSSSKLIEAGRGEEIGTHAASNDMAAALADASLLALLLTVSVADLRARLVPDRALTVATLIIVPLSATLDPSLSERGLAALGAGGFLLTAALIRPGAMGLGDVKLAAVLGLYLGRGVVAALLVAFVSGSLLGLALIARHGWAARSHTIPFAPFLSLGALVALALKLATD